MRVVLDGGLSRRDKARMRAAAPVTDPRVDAYVAAAAPFARPILAHLRALVHEAVPGCVEAIKWGRPFFLVDGRPFAMMAAFKQHAAFGFWRGGGIDDRPETGGAGQYGRLTVPEDLPDDAVLRDDLAAALATLHAGGPERPVRAAPRPLPAMPDDLAAALEQAPAARAFFDGLPPGQRRLYLEWVLAAKRPETRVRRIGEAVTMLAAGRRRS